MHSISNLIRYINRGRYSSQKDVGNALLIMYIDGNIIGGIAGSIVGYINRRGK
jgi:hypothetical protein